jgi:hypothetical protein
MPTTGQAAITRAEASAAPRRVRAGLRFVVVLVLAGVVAAAFVVGRGLLDAFGPPRCRATALGQSVSFTPDQMGNAATIVGIAMKRDLPARAATIAVATSIQESKLRNVRFGDRDSLGLFQQRPSQGWGTPQQILDPEYATNAFYDELVKIKGYQAMEITKVAQRVQKSAFPQAYAGHEQEGRVVASVMSGHSPAGLGCRLREASAGDPSKLRTAMRRELGVSPAAQGSTLVVTARDDQQAWGVASWAVAKASSAGVTRVTIDGRQWTRQLGPGGLDWMATGTSGSGDNRVTIAVAR